jgi:cytochrome P450
MLLQRPQLPFITRKIGPYLPGHIGYCFGQFDLWEKMTMDILQQFQRNELKSDASSMSFLATPLLLSVDTHLKRRLEDDEVLEELMGLTFAGSGTTSSTMTYLVYSLASDPELQDELRKELKTGDLTLSELQQLPLLSAVIKETMRLYPTIISTLPRVLDRPLTVGKHNLPPGTEVGMLNYVHHQDRIVFPEPDKFLPHRWLKRDAENKDMDAALTPFSLGPNNCIGQNLAKAELYVATSYIFRKLKLRLNPQMTEDDMEMEDHFAIAPKGRRLLVDVEVLA